MITIFFDRNSEIPLYEQLYQSIRDGIMQGELPSGKKLPSKRKLSQHLKISVQTVETSYSQLVAEGYLSSRSRSGYYVESISRPVTVAPIAKPWPNQATKQESHIHYDFRTNVVDPESFPFEQFAKMEKEVTQDEMGDCLNRTDMLGYLPLRQEIAKYLYQYRGIKVNADNILIGSGTDYLVMVISVLCRSNLAVGIEDPGYQKLDSLYMTLGKKTIAVRLDQSGISAQAIAKADIDLVHVTPSHQFPSGLVMPVARRMELLAWAGRKKGRHIVEDDYDSEFRFSGNPIPALKSLDYADNVIYMNAFAKSIAPGLRISFMVLPDLLLRKTRTELGFLTCPVSLFIQAAMARFMRTGLFERHLNRMKTNYKTKRDLLLEQIKTTRVGDWFEIVGSEAGLHFLLEAKAEVSEDELVKNALKAGVGVRGLNEYRHQPDACGKATIVLGYSAIRSDQIDKATRKLDQAWERLFLAADHH